MTLEAHTELAGRYVILRTIKAGGMGSVYEAVDRHLADTPCAVKEMLEQYLEDSNENRTFVQRCFAEEMRFLATLSHPLIPQVRDYFTSERKAYIVMELVRGDNLESELALTMAQGQRPFPAQVVVRDAIDVLDVLKYLHTQTPPVLHRDVKPANMVRDRISGAIKLVDFGLVRAWSGESLQTCVGTLAYAPLEQIQGHAEPRSDLYSLGATMLHLLTGRAPRPLQVPRLSEVAPEVDPRLAALVDRALATRVEQRFSSAAEMQDALVAWLDSVRDDADALPSHRRLEVEQHGSSPPLVVPSPPTLKVAAGATEVSPPSPPAPPQPDSKRRHENEAREWNSWLARTENTRDEARQGQRTWTGARLAVAALLLLLFGGMCQGMAVEMAAGATESPAPLAPTRRSAPASGTAPNAGPEHSPAPAAQSASVSVVSSSFGSGTVALEGRQVSFSAPRDWWFAGAEAADPGVRLLLQDTLQKKSIEVRLAVADPQAALAFEQQMVARLEEKGWKKQREIREGSAPTQYVMARPAADGSFEPAIVLAQHKPLASARVCCIVAVLQPGMQMPSSLEPDSRESQALRRTLQEMCVAFDDAIGSRI